MDDFEITPGLENGISFWELAGKPQYKQLEGETAGQFLARINDPTKWVYGSELRDRFLLKEPLMLPRFAHLSRKAFMHYGKERYNPNTISTWSELHVRTLIKWTIESKIERHISGYDWEWIDNFFMKVIYGELGLKLPDDYKPINRKILPQFRGPFFEITQQLAN
jgi:hypothetical protein